MGKIALKRENIPLLLFYIAYAIELAILLIDKSAYINPIEGRLFQLTFVLCTLKVAMTKYTNKEWVLMIAFLVLGAVSYFSTDRNEIIRFVMFVAASKGIDLKKLLKATFYVTLIGVLLLMVLSLTGVLGWNYVESDFDGEGPGGVIRRYCFGLGHPNALHCMIWAILLLAIYTFFDKIKWIHYCIFAIMNAILYYFTSSKTGMIITYLSIFTALVLCYSKKLRDAKIIYLLGAGSIIGGVLFSILNSIYGADTFHGPEGNIFALIDKYMSGRLWIAKRTAPVSGWTLFSNESCSEFFDMGYTRLFYWYGVIPAIIYLISICFLIGYCYKKRAYTVFIIVIMFGIYTIVEAHAISTYIARNYILLLFFGCWNEVFHVAGGREKFFYQLIGRKNKQTES